MQLDFNSAGAAHCSNPPCAAITMTSAEGYDVRNLTLPVFMVRLASRVSMSFGNIAVCL